MRFDGTMKPPTTPKLNQPRPFNQSAFQTVHFSDSPLFRPKQSAFQTISLWSVRQKERIYIYYTKKKKRLRTGTHPQPATKKTSTAASRSDTRLAVGQQATRIISHI